MHGIVSIAQYIFNWCKQPKAWHVANEMLLSDQRMTI